MRFVAKLVLAASFVFVSLGQERKVPLTLQSIESLVRDRLLPDETLAVEIRERGIDPLLQWRDVERLRNSGSGQATISALEHFVQPITLTLILEPPLAGLAMSVVSRGFGMVQSSRTGTTDSTGKAIIGGLRPGAYRVNLTPPPTHRFMEREIVLSDEGSVEHIALVPAPAKLSVLIQDARVEIGPLGSYNGPLRDLEIPAGSYAVSVSKAGHVTYTTSIAVGLGEEKSLTPTLKRNPLLLVAELKPLLERGNYAAFRERAEAVIDSDAEQLIDVKLLHHHASGFHESQLTISRTGIFFEPLGECTIRPGLIPIGQIKDVQLERQGSSGVLLHIQARRTLNFGVRGSSIGTETESKDLSVGRVNMGTLRTTRNRVRSPSGAADRLSAILWLISRVRSAADVK